MYFGAIAQWSRDCLPEFARLPRFVFWGTLGISSGCRVTVFGLPSHTECHWTNSRLITLQKKHNIRFSEFWRICVVADFPLDFPVVFTVSIIMIRLRYIIESCQSFQTVLCCCLLWEIFRFRFFALSVEFGTKAVACYVKGYHHNRLAQGVWSSKPPLFGAACIDQASSYLEGAEQAPLPSNEALQWAILRVIFCHNAVRVNFKHDIRGSKFTLITKH